MPSVNGTTTTPTAATATSATAALYRKYPVNTSWELTLRTGETVKGTVYCTDEVSETVFLQKNLTHTTLATELFVVHAAHITQAAPLSEGDAEAAAGTPALGQLPQVQKKALEDREKRAMRLAEESFRHINDKASPEGQQVFDRLLKACNEVAWKGESILVLNQIRVDPPYRPDNCRIVKNSSQNKASSKSGGSLDYSALERVKKIVAATSNNTSSN